MTSDHGPCIVQTFAMAKKRAEGMKGLDTETYVARVQGLIGELARLMAHCEETCLGPHGITVAQSYTIMSLPRDGDLAMNALSQALGVAGSTATRMVDQLVRKQLVTRRQDPEDRRVVRVSLTGRGRELRQDLEKATDSCFASAFADVPEGERPSTLQVLESVATSLRKSLERQ